MSKYIDTDLLNKIKFHPLPYTHITPNDVDAESYKRGWNDVIDTIIENEPPADVQEVKRGFWIGGEIGYCSYCAHKGCASDIWNGCKGDRYCPNCGAQMYERNEDEL